MVDNHDSHERSRPIEAAMRNDIVIFAFPSHCTHLVQMLDVSFFKSLKSHYKKVARSGLILSASKQSPTYRRLYFSNYFIVLGVELASRMCSLMGGRAWDSKHVGHQAWLLLIEML